MAICVVAIHTRPLLYVTNEHIQEIYEAIVRMAVPFFFLSSGYLLAVKLEYPYHGDDAQKRIWTYFRRILGMYVLWTFLYLPWTIQEYIGGELSIVDATISFLRGFFIFGEHSISWMLWYLLSTIYALLIIALLLKKRTTPKIIWILGVVLLLVGIGIDNLETKGRLFQGVFYLFSGMLLAHKPLPLKLNGVLFLGGFLANCVISNGIASQFLVLASSIGLFGLTLVVPLKNSPIYPILRSTSTGLYFLHMWIWTLYNKLTVNADIWGMDCFVVAVIGCIVLSLLYIGVRKLLSKRALTF